MKNRNTYSKLNNHKNATYKHLENATRTVLVGKLKLIKGVLLNLPKELEID